MEWLWLELLPGGGWSCGGREERMVELRGEESLGEGALLEGFESWF